MSADLFAPLDRRRIDITLSRLDDVYQAMPEADRKSAWADRRVSVVAIVARLRGMELAEASLGYGAPLADTYDRLVVAGDPAHEAILKTFREYMQPAKPPSIGERDDHF